MARNITRLYQQPGNVYYVDIYIFGAVFEQEGKGGQKEGGGGRK